MSKSQASSAATRSAAPGFVEAPQGASEQTTAPPAAPGEAVSPDAPQRAVAESAPPVAPPAETAEVAAPAKTGVGVSPPSPAAEAPDELAQLRAEVAALRDRNLRLQADVQNTLRRAQREKEEAIRFAEADFARELLAVLDDLERTVAAAETAGDKAHADGVRIVLDHFLKVLRQRAIVPLVAVGEPFDPSRHEALMQEPSTERPAGTVLRELARGYVMHERVLRPSRVVVSSGPPEAAPATDAAEPSRSE